MGYVACASSVVKPLAAVNYRMFQGLFCSFGFGFSPPLVFTCAREQMKGTDYGCLGVVTHFYGPPQDDPLTST